MFSGRVWTHALVSLALTTLVNVLATNVPPRVLGDDYARLYAEGGDNIWTPLMPLALYWCSYALLSLVCLFLTVIYQFASLVLHALLFRALSAACCCCCACCVSQWPFAARLVVKLTHVAFSLLVATLGVSTLAHVSLFYAGILCLAINNPLYSQQQQQQQRHRMQRQPTRLLLGYLLLILNIAPLITWIKSLGAGNVHIQSLAELSHDNGTQIALACIALDLVYFLKDQQTVTSSRTSRRLFRAIRGRVLSKLVLANALLTILFATLSLYRLGSFVLAHLALMALHEDGDGDDDDDDRYGGDAGDGGRKPKDE